MLNLLCLTAQTSCYLGCCQHQPCSNMNSSLKNGLFYPLSLILLITAFHCTAAEKTIQNAQNTENRQNEQSKMLVAYEDLLKRLPTDTQVEWLQGKEGIQFPILIKPNQSPKPWGNIILIPTSDHHGDWPGPIRTLRAQLPKHGWTTVSISMGEVIVASASTSTSDTPSSGSSSDNNNERIKSNQQANGITFTANTPKSEQSPKLTNEERIHLTLNYSVKEFTPPFFTFIAEGDSATITMTALLNERKINPLAIILLNATPDKTLEQLILQAETPIIEVVSDQNPYLKEAKMRAVRISQKKSEFHSLNVITSSNPNFEYQEVQLLKRIRGIIARIYR